MYKKWLNVLQTKSFQKTLSYPSRNRSDKCVILGIETSCDDTGCGIVNSDGKILGESINSQSLLHLRLGGIIPPIAQDLHRKHIEPVVEDAIKKANIDIKDIDAIAVTVEPGLALSLVIGLKYAKYLHMKYKTPLIPIHHMEAHALMARMENNIEYPFLTLLISGGHCLLALVKAVDDFTLLGDSLDGGPGEVFDKVARRLKLTNIKEFSTMSGGQAIETAAQRATDPLIYNFPSMMSHYRDCNFSFSGFKTTMYYLVTQMEIKQSVGPDDLVPDVYNLCAAFQYGLTKHICQRTQRAMAYIDRLDLIPEGKRTLVVSGGVACNNFLFKALQIVCRESGYTAFRPRPILCTDNGIMIAWNGVEKWREGIGIHNDVTNIGVKATKPLSKNCKDEITEMCIKCNWVKLKELL